ncbi:MAG: hypothetical protein FJZ92_06105, partial [Chloroflexi bacterium]|nr:hypothetical protein [Chloroflexota bacterium]
MDKLAQLARDGGGRRVGGERGEPHERPPLELEAKLRRLIPVDGDATVAAVEEMLSIPRLWPRMTEAERAAVVKASLAFAAVETDGATLGAFAPRPHLEPLFQAMAMSGGKIRSCDWRPRSDWG